MSTRVIAGTAKGQRLKLVPGDSTRPITDKVKEALFSILGSDVNGVDFLDLFGGTGAVGIEALSRGAAHVLFCDTERLALKTIHDNLSRTGLRDRAEVRQVNALELLRQNSQHPFDIVFIAPPQYKGLWRQALEALDGNPSWLQPNATVVVQIDPREQEDVWFHHLRAYDERRYGRTLLWFFEAVVEES